MRRLLMSAAALALLAVPALVAAPVSAQPEHSNRVGKASVAPQVQDRAQAELRHPPPPQQQAQQQQGGRFGHDRNPGSAAPAAIRPAAPVNRGERDNARGPGNDRGFASRRGDGNNNNARSLDNRGDRRDFNRYRRGGNFGNRDNRRAFGNGQRHDYSGFRDYHRSFRVSRRYRTPFYRRPAGWYAHRWTFGEFLPAAFWARDYWLLDFQAYDLPPPPYGAVWVRVGNDALLVDEDTGEIITVAYDVFY